MNIVFSSGTKDTRHTHKKHQQGNATSTEKYKINIHIPSLQTRSAKNSVAGSRHRHSHRHRSSAARSHRHRRRQWQLRCRRSDLQRNFSNQFEEATGSFGIAPSTQSSRLNSERVCTQRAPHSSMWKLDGQRRCGTNDRLGIWTFEVSSSYSAQMREVSGSTSRERVTWIVENPNFPWNSRSCLSLTPVCRVESRLVAGTHWQPLTFEALCSLVPRSSVSPASQAYREEWSPCGGTAPRRCSSSTFDVGNSTMTRHSTTQSRGRRRRRRATR